MNLKYLLSYSVALSAVGFIWASTHLQNAADLKPILAETLSHQGPNTSGQGSAVGPIRNLRFVLFDAGIQPREMRVKAGLVNISVEDKTNVSEGLTIQRIVGRDSVALGAVQKLANQKRSRNLFTLLPGEYEVYDSSKPTNRASLLVEQ